MPHRPLTLILFFLGNFIPTIQIIVSVGILYFQPNFLGLVEFLTWIYLVPPLVLRIIHLFFGQPHGTYSSDQRGFWVWYFGAQIQALFIRFPFFEELLKVFPLVYSNWLRLWGAKVGKATYWGPKSYVLDRPFLNIGDYVVIGFGVGISGHLLNYEKGRLELVVATSVIGDATMLGGLSGVGPGAEVASKEMLPATMQLAPFYKWVDGRRKSINTINNVDNS